MWLTIFVTYSLIYILREKWALIHNCISKIKGYVYIRITYNIKIIMQSNFLFQIKLEWIYMRYGAVKYIAQFLLLHYIYYFIFFILMLFIVSLIYKQFN